MVTRAAHFAVKMATPPNLGSQHNSKYCIIDHTPGLMFYCFPMRRILQQNLSGQIAANLQRQK